MSITNSVGDSVTNSVGASVAQALSARKASVRRVNDGTYMRNRVLIRAPRGFVLSPCAQEGRVISPASAQVSESTFRSGPRRPTRHPSVWSRWQPGEHGDL